MHNVQNPEKFLKSLIAVNDAVYDFMDAVMEDECETPADPVLGDGYKPALR
jgi:hypothetical protein